MSSCLKVHDHFPDVLCRYLGSFETYNEDSKTQYEKIHLIDWIFRIAASTPLPDIKVVSDCGVLMATAVKILLKSAGKFQVLKVNQNN